MKIFWRSYVFGCVAPQTIIPGGEREKSMETLVGEENIAKKVVFGILETMRQTAEEASAAH